MPIQWPKLGKICVRRIISFSLTHLVLSVLCLGKFILAFTKKKSEMSRPFVCVGVGVGVVSCLNLLSELQQWPRLGWSNSCLQPWFCRVLKVPSAKRFLWSELGRGVNGRIYWEKEFSCYDLHSGYISVCVCVYWKVTKSTDVRLELHGVGWMTRIRKIHFSLFLANRSLMKLPLVVHP